MPRKGESADEFFARRMRQFQQGEMRSSAGQKVMSRDMAVAIIMSELRKKRR